MGVVRAGRGDRTGSEVVRKFFKLIDSGRDVGDLLDLFEYDAVLKEPFSKHSSAGLRGRSEIEPFLKVALMASSDMRRRIRLEERLDGKNVVNALVTFEKGDRLRGRFVFELDPEGKKIRRLTVQLGDRPGMGGDN